MVRNLVEVKTRVPEKVVQFVNELAERGHYSNIAISLDEPFSTS